MFTKNEEIIYSLQKFQNALNRCREALEFRDSPIVVDAVIQRFEFSFELAWKTLKRVLFSEGISALSPRDALKESFRLGFLSDENIWLEMLSDRNSMSHTYNEAQALSVFEKVPCYCEAMSKLLENLKDKYRSDLQPG